MTTCLKLTGSGTETDGSKWATYDDVPCLKKNILGRMVWNKPDAQYYDFGDYTDAICGVSETGIPTACSAVEAKEKRAEVFEQIGNFFSFGTKIGEAAKTIGVAVSIALVGGLVLWYLPRGK